MIGFTLETYYLQHNPQGKMGFEMLRCQRLSCGARATVLRLNAPH
jgi:hypothetical protein